MIRIEFFEGGRSASIGRVGDSSPSAGTCARRLALTICWTLAALLLWLQGVPAASCDASASPAPLRQWLSQADPVARAHALYYFSRRVPVRVFGEAVIPFAYPERPTVELRIGGSVYPMLFDTGTYTCIFAAGIDWPVPAGQRTDFVSALAQLESKAVERNGVSLDYMLVDTAALGEIHFRDLPFRLYSLDRGGERDYAGAFAPYVLRDFVIEVSNTDRQISLHRRASYTPPAGSAVLPLLVLPRGIFVPLIIAGEQYWFHLDTGFSGQVGVLPELLSAHPGCFTAVGNAADYGGWRTDSEYQQLALTGAQLRPYTALTWGTIAPIELGEIQAVAYPNRYAELAGYGIGGIVGSGLLQRFDYQLDLELCRLLILSPAG